MVRILKKLGCGALMLSAIVMIYFTTNSVNNWSTAQMEYAMSRGSAGGMGSSDTHNQTVNTPSLLANGGRSSVVGSGSGHSHSLSASGS